MDVLSYFCNNLITRINNYGHKFSWSEHKLFVRRCRHAHRYRVKELNRIHSAIQIASSLRQRRAEDNVGITAYRANQSAGTHSYYYYYMRLR